MGWVCTAGHFTAVNLRVPLAEQRPGGTTPPYGAVCRCGRAAWPMIVCTEREHQEHYDVLRASVV